MIRLICKLIITSCSLDARRIRTQNTFGNIVKNVMIRGKDVKHNFFGIGQLQSFFFLNYAIFFTNFWQLIFQNSY
jgi:hypothetical protein